MLNNYISILTSLYIYAKIIVDVYLGMLHLHQCYRLRLEENELPDPSSAWQLSNREWL